MVLAIMVCGLIFGLHMLPAVDSMLNENNLKISHHFLRSQIDYHAELPPFARRPLTTLLMYGFIGLLGLKAGYAFIFVNFSLLALSGYLLYRLSLTLKASRRQAIINMLMYFGSFSILFAFFPPVFTYDEPLQYCFLFIALNYYFSGNRFRFVLFFSLALIARETSILLLPALLYLENRRVKWLSASIFIKRNYLVFTPVLFYTIYLAIFMYANNLFGDASTEMTRRWSCFLENFESEKNILESVVSIHFTLSFFALITLFPKKKKHQFSNLVIAFWITALINTPIVILSAFARESRLFALPLLFIWPIFAQFFYPSLVQNWKNFLSRPLSYKTFMATLFVLCFFGNYYFCYKIYSDFGLGDNNFFTEYLFLLNFLILILVLLSFTKKSTGAYFFLS